MVNVKQWIPLESNPEVMTKFGRALGLPETVSFNDIWSLDLLDMLPKPTYAVLLLFPVKESLKNAATASSLNNVSKEQEEQIKSSKDNEPFFCKQTISNACGTIALMHAALNSKGIEYAKDSFLSNFKKDTLRFTPEQRAVALQNNQKLDDTHSHFASEGQSAIPQDLNNINLHFVCFVNCNGFLYLLDGRTDSPVLQGVTSDNAFLQDTAHIIQTSYMAADPTEHRFTIVALTNNPEY